MTETRKLAAILAADVVGYSRLASTDEDRTLARLRALRSDLIDPTVAVHNGRVVKRTGDGSLIEFRSVVDAVRCAIEVQNGMAERNAGLPAERRIEFRVGVHLGDVVEESDGDLMGDGVNIAARLEGIAEPGAICLSEDAYRQVRARLDFAVSDLGETQLKNIAEPVRVYSLQVGVPAQAKPVTHPEPIAPEKTFVPSNQPLMWGAALIAVVILIGGGMLYMRQTARTPPPALQPAAPTPPPAPAPPQQTAAPTSPPAPVPQVAVPPPLPVSEDTAWQDALSAHTLAALDGFLKTYGSGLHVQDAKLQIVNLIVAEPAPSKNFDGTWQTTWTCANVGQSLGYTFEFRGQIKDGTYHGLHGTKGQPGSLELEGKIEADGTAGFKGAVIVNSPITGMGAARGTVSPVYALARFDHASGTGSRINLRPCTLTFVKQ
jgi:class 3 adenylate cyclase